MHKRASASSSVGAAHTQAYVQCEERMLAWYMAAEMQLHTSCQLRALELACAHQ